MQSRVFAAAWAMAAMAVLLLTGLGELAADPPKPARSAPPSPGAEPDPLLDALRDLQRDIDALRNEMRGVAPAKLPAKTSLPASTSLPAKTSPPGRMSSPGMGSAPAMGAPAMDSAPAMGSAPSGSNSRPLGTIVPPAPSTRRPGSAKFSGDPLDVPAQPVAETYPLWSFQPLKRPAAPAVQNGAWPAGDIDRFVLARREAAGLASNADADRYTLIRRLSFDLIGLPPSEQEIADFVRDPASDSQALARLVDRLLASRHFGERWARHWLDVVRYADSVGRTWNAPFTHAWRYRDWVIDAFNADLPYNRFVVEQIAGDLLPADSPERRRSQLIATGLLTLGSVNIQEGSYEPYILERVDDQLDVSTRAVLGLSVSCARCHNHKYDPVSIRDYYALAGIFYSSETHSGQGLLSERAPNGYVDYQRLLNLAPTGSSGSMPSSAVSNPRNLPEIRSMAEFQHFWTAGHREMRYANDDLAMGVTEGQPRDCQLRFKGEPYDRGPAPPRGDVHIAGLPPLEPISADESGRLQFARWLVAPNNPLTARVMANRVWQHLLGQGLVRTVDDFGTVGEEPSHAELLDYLASELRENGWSVKQLIRTIALSRAYRQSSAGNATNEAVDPRNELLWRANLRRLEVEPLRDAMLYVAGRLQTARPAGIQVAGTGGKARQSMTHSLLAIDAPYRTIYLPVLRSLLPEMLDTFDFANPTQITGQRYVTTVATQALFLMNSRFASDCATLAAERLLGEPAGSDADRIRLAYLRLLGRGANASDVTATQAFLASLRPGAETRDPQLYRWTVLVQAMLGSAEFGYIR